MRPDFAGVLGAAATSGQLGLPSIGIAGAFFGGLFALLSPCAALLLPSFFAYSFGGRMRLVARTGVFYLGLAAVLVPLGAGVGAIGSLLTRYRDQATFVGGLVMIAFGVMIIAGRGFSIPGTSRGMGRLAAAGPTAGDNGRGAGRDGHANSRFVGRGLGTGSLVGIAALGAVYGLAGFCAGPLVGAVLTVAAAGGSAAYGGLLMAVYALGLAVPLLALALVWDRWRLGERRWLRGRLVRVAGRTFHSTSLIAGALFVVIGLIFLLTSGTANLGGILPVQADYQLQVWLSHLAGALSDITVLFALAVAVLIVTAVRIVVKHRRVGAPVNTRSAHSDASISTDHSAAPVTTPSDQSGASVTSAQGSSADAVQERV